MYRVYIRKFSVTYGQSPITIKREMLYANDINAYNPNTEYIGEGFQVKITTPILTLEESVAGTFTFDIPVVHRLYSDITILDTIIEIERDNIPYWAGRVISTSANFNKTMSVVCEGLFACLNDTIQPYMIYNDYPTKVFRQIITNHNNICAQRKHRYKAINSLMISRSKIYGPVKDTDPVDDSMIKIAYEQNNATTMDALQNFISTYGGYLRITYDFHDWSPKENEPFEKPCINIDWCEDAADISGRVLNEQRWKSTQVVRYASNLIDMQLDMAGENMYTVLVPRGTEVKRDILPQYLIWGFIADDGLYRSPRDISESYTDDIISTYGFNLLCSAQYIPYQGEGDNISITINVKISDILEHYKRDYEIMKRWHQKDYNPDTLQINTCYLSATIYGRDKAIDPNLDEAYVKFGSISGAKSNRNEEVFKFSANSFRNIWERVDHKKYIPFFKFYFYFKFTGGDLITYNVFIPTTSTVTATIYNDQSRFTLFGLWDSDENGVDASNVHFRPYYPKMIQDGQEVLIPDGDTGNYIRYEKQGNRVIDTSKTTGVGKYGWIEKIIDYDIALVPQGEDYLLSLNQLYETAMYELQYGRYSDFSIEVNAFDLSLYNKRPMVIPKQRPTKQSLFTNDNNLFITNDSKVIITENDQEG